MQDSSKGQTSQDSKLRAHLQKRVAAMFRLGMIVWGSLTALGLAGIDPIYRREVIGWPGLAVLTFATVVWAACTLLTWLRRDWSLRALRLFEVTMLITHAGSLVGMRILQFRFAITSEPAAAVGDNLLLDTATLHNGFGWLAGLVAWGLVFPHPWRRMLALIFGLALCPLLVDVGLVLAEPTRFVALSYSFILTGQMVATGAMMALFGSYRLNKLEEEVAVARSQARAARQLGPYTLKRKLGAGGMGEVYLADHRLLKRPCAVKLIRPERSGDLQVLARFNREVQATAKLKHPNTVDVFDYGRTEDGTFYYVMEYLDGMSLDEMVRRHGPLPVARVIHLLRQLCGALREAHGQGLVHRDIKPSNILLCRHGGLFDVVKLVDFGLVQEVFNAADSSKLTLAGALTGTPDYMSPEQADGHTTDPGSDLYSVGATAYFLLTGRPPFTGKTVLDVLFAHRTQPVPDLVIPGVAGPLELEGILRRCLAKSSQERFPSAADLESALKTCAESAPWSEVEAKCWWDSVGRSGEDCTSATDTDGAMPNQALQQTGPALRLSTAKSLSSRPRC